MERGGLPQIDETEQNQPEVEADFKVPQFLVEAEDYGAYEVLTDLQRTVVELYGFCDLVFEDIGKMMDLKAKNKRSRPQQIVERTLRRLHSSCPPDVQQKYPLKEILVRRPWGETSRDRNSASRGGKRAQIRQKIAEGLTKPSEIARALSLKPKNVRMTLLRLRIRGLGLESLRERTQRIIKEARSAATNEEIRAVFAQAAHYLARDNPDVFVSVSAVARWLGFRFGPPDFISFLEVMNAANLPFLPFERLVKSGKNKGAKLAYHYVLTQQVPEIAGLFMNEPKLGHFRKLKTYSQIAGPTIVIPNTSLFRNNTGYRGFLKEVLAMGIGKEELFANCPVPIFRGGRSHYWVGESDYGKLIKFCRGLKKS